MLSSFKATKGNDWCMTLQAAESSRLRAGVLRFYLGAVQFFASNGSALRASTLPPGPCVRLLPGQVRTQLFTCARIIPIHKRVLSELASMIPATAALYGSLPLIPSKLPFQQPETKNHQFLTAEISYLIHSTIRSQDRGETGSRSRQKTTVFYSGQIQEGLHHSIKYRSTSSEK
eukprot:5781393-Amphidinium_carterae.1